MPRWLTMALVAAALGAAALGAIRLWGATRTVTLAAFTTDLSGRSPAQRHNMALAAARLNGMQISPGGIFSFNRAVGERLRALGYQPAPAIVQGELLDSPGGGLCQVSSTLYNAALLAGLPIVERRPHVWVIRCVGPGRDATVADRSADLQFRNPYPWTIGLGVEITGDRLVARVVGAKPLPAPIAIEVERLQTLWPSGGRPGAGWPGCRVRVWRVTQPAGGTARRALISEDTYQPVAPAP